MATKWKLKGSISNNAMSNGLFIFSFVNQEDMDFILIDGPWAYGRNNFLSLCKRKANLDLWKDLGVVSPTWISLPGHPFKFWNMEFFKGITNSFGNFLTVDYITQNKSRLIYARICVNVSINTMLLTKVTLLSMLVS